MFFERCYMNKGGVNRETPQKRPPAPPAPKPKEENMKILDLLDKLSKGEEVPKKIKWFDRWQDKKLTYVFHEINKDYRRTDCSEYLFNDHFMTESLNDEIEIVEEKPVSLKPYKDYLSDLNETSADIEDAVVEYVHQLSLKVNYLLEKESDKQDACN